MSVSECYIAIQDNNVCIITTHMIIWHKYYSSLIKHKWFKHKQQHHSILSDILLLYKNNHHAIITITIIISYKHLHIIINIIISIIRFLTLSSLASLSTPSSTRVRTVSSLPFILAKWRAVRPSYNNNEEMRHGNKIKNKNVKMMISRMMIVLIKTWWWYLLW